MVVDDSAVVRGLLTRYLEEDPDITVVASVTNGKLALEQLDRHTIDVVVLDIEMPVMDGMTALPRLLEKQPGLVVIMASTLTLKNADISLRAMSMGAADYVPKPTSAHGLTTGVDFRRELVSKVKSLGRQRGGRAGGGRQAFARPTPPARPAPAANGTARPAAKPAVRGGPITLRPAATTAPEILAIGSSTGGPQALFKLLGGLGGKLPLPIVITQHMPPTFTTILAEHISRASGWPCTEAKDGDPLRAGHILVAPGDYHMVVEAKGTQRVVRLNQNPPENFCRPSVDPMLRSMGPLYGRKLLTVILTGMGQDGLEGGRKVVEAGGTIIAQDEATSVVWGMPGAVAQAGLCSAVLPLTEIAPMIRQQVTRRG